MNFNECMNVLCALNSKKYLDVTAETLTDINHKLNSINYTLPEDCNNKFTYIQKNVIDTFCIVIFNTFFRLKEILQTTHIDISLQHLTIIKTSIFNLKTLSICTNQIENLPGYISSGPIENTIMEKYTRLCNSADKLIALLKSDQLRDVILNDCFSSVITALYQILYAPLKKPRVTETKCDDSFVMTEYLYKELTNDRGYFQDAANFLLMPQIKRQYVTAIMLLMACRTPVWFQRAVSTNLTSIMRDKDGFETIAVALLENTADYDANDTSKNWRSLNILVKLFVEFRASSDFTTNICRQLLNLLNIKDSLGCFIKPFELIVVKCVKELYLIEPNTSVDVLLNHIYSKPFFSLLSISNCTIITGDVTLVITQSTRILHHCFMDNSLDSADLPISLLSPIVLCLLKLHAKTVKCLPIINGQLKDLLLKYIANEEMGHKLFDAAVFDMVFPANDVYLHRNDVEINIADASRIIVKNKSVEASADDKEDLEEGLLNILEARIELLMNLFRYLFNRLINKNKPFNNLNIYRLITKLTYNKSVLEHLNTNPDCLIPHFEAFLEVSIQQKMHLNKDGETTNDPQPLFTVIMIVQLLAQTNLRDSGKLIQFLQVISKETNIPEIKLLIADVLNKLLKNDGVKLTGDMFGVQKNPEDSQVMIATEVDKAITDVCDPLLPVRAHGLIQLTRLVENRHPDVLKRKQYIFNVFQQNLKNEDSFIYLNAIGGLSAMGELFPDTVLPLLASEYADYSIQRAFDDEIELRLKLGEVLLRVTKTLGDRASQHKALLLNTFLKTTKDDDHLIRASSLSNVAEVCRVLGEKIGSIIIEVFSCVQHIIDTDVAPEPRRAAISVIRQMLVGADKQMLIILRNQMPIIYRTLLNAYKNDSDEVTRLHAQLALEQLDVNMRAILMPNESASGDEKKKIVEEK